MVKNKPTVEEKREQARKVILDAAMELFHAKGYDNTTTRDIINKAGILNGSLYNRFKNKDEILACIINEALAAVLKKCSTILEAERNLLLASVFPGALEIYASSRFPHLASLLYEVHRKWSTISMYLEINKGWRLAFSEYFGVPPMDPELANLKIISSAGSVGNIVGYYADGGTLDVRLAIREHAVQVATMMGVPTIDLEALVDRLIHIIENSEIIFLGHDLRRELDGKFND